MIAKHISREQKTIDNTAGGLGPTALSEADRRRHIYTRVQIQTAQVRATYDGSTAPVASTTGELTGPGTVFNVWGIDNRDKLKMIRETATSGLAIFNDFGS